MIEKKVFKKSIATPLENAGYVKKGQSWYLDRPNTIIVLNVQKSDWGNMYFLNFGIWIKALGQETFPEYNFTHINGRVDRIFPENRDLFLMSCDLNKTNGEIEHFRQTNNVNDIVLNNTIEIRNGSNYYSKFTLINIEEVVISIVSGIPVGFHPKFHCPFCFVEI